MTVFLDHVKLTGVRVDDYVLPREVAGVEIYLGAASLPAEYGGADARCGAIVIWTK